MFRQLCKPKLWKQSIFNLSTVTSLQTTKGMEIDISPPICRCDQTSPVLDRSVFQKSIHIIAARVPAIKSGKILRADEMKRMILNVPKVRTVVPVASNASLEIERLVLLNVNSPNQLTAEAFQFLTNEEAVFEDYSVKLDYDYWTSNEILHALLPEELCDGIPTGFAITGHLAHFNLNDEYLPYKHIIGQVVLDKHKNIRTVVNKLGSIHSQFRFFDMELIAGEPDFIVEHHESNCHFTFDFSKVYWNSRLHTEHERLVRQFIPGDGIIADVFAGVGPFAIPAAKKGCAVLANDLNPESAKWLSKNAIDNQVTNSVRVTCEDGRDFIRASIQRVFTDPFILPTGSGVSKRRRLKDARQNGSTQDHLEDRRLSTQSDPTKSDGLIQPPLRRITHFIMNLPDTAIEFLDVFKGLLSQCQLPRSVVENTYSSMPMVHCYCFSRYLETEEAAEDIKKRVKEILQYDLNAAQSVTFHMVRSVAPNKNMYYVSFVLPKEVLFR